MYQRRSKYLILFTCCLSLFFPLSFCAQSSYNSSNEILNNLPLTFRKNLGQWEKKIQYVATSPAWKASVCFMKNELSFCFARHTSKKHMPKEFNIHEYDEREYLAWNVSFEGANHNSTIAASGEESSKTNYMLGNDPSNFAINVPDYKIIQYNDVYNNINLRYYSTGTELKYDYLIQPGGSVKDIKMKCTGIQKLTLNNNGELQIHTIWGILTEKIPESYQIIDEKKQNTNVVYKLYNETTFGFEIDGGYNKNYELVIDPVSMLWATYAGATQVSDGYLHDIDVDASGNIYATGMHQAFYPTTPGAYQPNFSGGSKRDVFVFKMDPNGTSLIYATYLGGPSPDAGYSIAVNASGEAFVAGWTSSSVFPVTAGAFDVNFDGSDAFITRLNSTGTGLIYSTFVSGSGGSEAYAIAINGSNEAYITGKCGNNFPITAGAYDQVFNGGSLDAFITKINAAGSALLYSSYIGGSVTEQGEAIVINAAGEAVVAGRTDSNDFTTTPGSYNTSNSGGQFDMFVCKFNTTGSALAYSTYIGGSGYEIPLDIKLNSTDELYIAGISSSNNYPVTVGAYDQTHNGLLDIVATKLNAAGSTLVFSTYIGGSNSDNGWGIALNPLGEIFISGHTTSTDFPITSCAYNTNSNGGDDIIVCKLNSTGSGLHYSTYVGGSADDYKHTRLFLPTPSACGLEEPIIAGTTHSTNIPVTAGAFQTTNYTLGDDAPMVFKLKKPTINAGFTYSSSTTCNTAINFTDTTNQCGLWSPLTSWDWDFGDGTNSTQQHPTHTFTVAGTYHVKLKVGCPLDSVTIPITITNITAAAAGLDTSTCDGVPVQLNGTAGGSGNIYSWSPAIGLNNSSILNPTANPITTTTYVLTVTNGGICPAYDTIVVSVNQKPTSVISGTNNICSGTNTTLTASGSLAYSWTMGATTNTLTISPASNSTYTVIGANGTCYDTATFSINVTQSPVAAITGTLSICEGDNIQLTASGGNNFLWSTGSTNTMINISPTTSSIYSLTVYNGYCIDTSSVNITVNQMPVANAGLDDTICSGQIVTLNASGGSNYLWSNGISTSVNTVSPTINSIYTVTVANGNCKDIDAVEIEVTSSPTAIISGSYSIIKGENITLSASGGTSYNWSPSSGLSCNNCQYPIASPQVNGNYCVTVTNDFGCSDTTCVAIIVNEIFCKEIFIPTAFSPNSDGQNDVYLLKSNCIRQMKFSIYDRWGNKVFETTDITKEWNGTYEGKDLDTSVFAYTLNVIYTDGIDEVLKGNISLIK